MFVQNQGSLSRPWRRSLGWSRNLPLGEVDCVTSLNNVSIGTMVVRVFEVDDFIVGERG